jgi:hypothetical protein
MSDLSPQSGPKRTSGTHGDEHGSTLSPSFQRYQVLSLPAYRDFMWIDVMGARDGNPRLLGTPDHIGGDIPEAAQVIRQPKDDSVV